MVCCNAISGSCNTVCDVALYPAPAVGVDVHALEAYHFVLTYAMTQETSTELLQTCTHIDV